MLRQDLSRLKKDRPIYLKLGMLFSLSFVILCFNFTTYPEDMEPVQTVYVADDEIKVVRTVHEKKRTPPPPKIDISKTLDIIDEPEFIETPEPDIIEPIEIPVNAKIVKVAPKPAPVVAKPPPVPVVLPPDPTEDLYNGEALIFAEEMPRFPGCEEKDMNKKAKHECSVSALLTYLRSNLKYPHIARDNGIDGTVVLTFIVELDGNISDIKVMRDLGGGLGQEAVRVVKKMPTWSPGKQRGKPVRVKYTLPVKFSLMD